MINLHNDRLYSHVSANKVKPLGVVKNIIAVASGKGGVGKSTVSMGITKAVQQLGLRVGILDADIYGPSIGHMLGTNQKPVVYDDKTFDPVIAQGFQSMSIDYLLQDKAPTIWRGPMVSGALQQLLFQTRWKDLDLLIIDLPPGTGDIHLTLLQKIPLTATVIVTTPQQVALLDANKAIGMFNKLNVPILGIIENMSSYICPNCSHHEDLFSSGGAENTASDYGINFLGKLPLNKKLRIEADQGNINPEPFITITTKMLEQLCKLERNLELNVCLTD